MTDLGLHSSNKIPLNHPYVLILIVCNIFRLIVEKFRSNYDQNTTALAIITHGFGVQVVLDSMNIFSLTDMVEFCSINIFDYR